MYNELGQEEVVKSNMLLGMVGAFFGACIGSIVWVVVYQFGFIASIAGAAVAYCAFRGYAMLGKVLDKKGVILTFIISLLVILLANYLCWSYDVFTLLGEMYYDVTFFEAFGFLMELLQDSEYLFPFLKDTLIGYAFMTMVCIPYFKMAFSKNVEETESNIVL